MRWISPFQYLKYENQKRNKPKIADIFKKLLSQDLSEEKCHEMKQDLSEGKCQEVKVEGETTPDASNMSQGEVIDAQTEKIMNSYWRGFQFFCEGRFDLAIGHVTTCIGLLPVRCCWLYRLRGIAFMGQQKLSKAMTDFDTFIQCNKNEEEICVCMLKGQIHSLLGDYNKAHQLFGKLKELLLEQNHEKEQMAECEPFVMKKEILEAAEQLVSSSYQVLETKQKKTSLHHMEHLKLAFTQMRNCFLQFQNHFFDFIDPNSASNSKEHHGDITLTISDCIKLATCKHDTEARTMGVLLLGDHVSEDESVLSEVITLGGTDAIFDILLNHPYKSDADIELKFFATRALSDLCCLSNLEIRWKMVRAGIVDSLIKQTKRFANEKQLLGAENKSWPILDLVGVSIFALACMGRGGTGIDRIIFQKGALPILSTLLQKITSTGTGSQLVLTKRNEKLCLYIVQAISCLTVDIENKIQTAEHKNMVSVLHKLVTSHSVKGPIEHFSLIAIGNICQNPEIFGRPDQYNTFNSIVKYLSNLYPDIVAYLNNNLKYGTNIELQYNSIVTLTHLIGFSVIRDKIEDDYGGERNMLQPLLTSPIASIRDFAAKAIRFYRTLRDYSDRVSEVLLAKFRLVQIQQQEDKKGEAPALEDEEMNEPESKKSVTVDKKKAKSPSSIKPSTSPTKITKSPSKSSLKSLSNKQISALKRDMINDEELAEIMNDTIKNGLHDEKESFETLSYLMSSLFGVAAFVWNVDDEANSSKSKTVSQHERIDQNEKNKGRHSASSTRQNDQSKMQQTDEKILQDILAADSVKKNRKKRKKKSKKSQKSKSLSKQTKESPKQFEEGEEECEDDEEIVKQQIMTSHPKYEPSNLHDDDDDDDDDDDEGDDDDDGSPRKNYNEKELSVDREYPNRQDMNSANTLLSENYNPSQSHMSSITEASKNINDHEDEIQKYKIFVHEFESGMLSLASYIGWVDA